MKTKFSRTAPVLLLLLVTPFELCSAEKPADEIAKDLINRQSAVVYNARDDSREEAIRAFTVNSTMQLNHILASEQTSEELRILYALNLIQRSFGSRLVEAPTESEKELLSQQRTLALRLIAIQEGAKQAAAPDLPSPQSGATPKPVLLQVSELITELAKDRGFSDQDAEKVSVLFLEKLVGSLPEGQKLSTRITASSPERVRVFASYDFGIGFTGFEIEFGRGNSAKGMSWAHFHLIEQIPSE